MAAVEALSAVREKVDDYFTRVAMAEFDPRAAALMNAREEELVRLGFTVSGRCRRGCGPAVGLSAAGRRLAVQQGPQPSLARVPFDEFRQRVVGVPVYGELDSLSREQWQHLVALCGSYLAWRAETPTWRLPRYFQRGRFLELVDRAPSASAGAGGRG